jgi:hypothetical protein
MEQDAILDDSVDADILNDSLSARDFMPEGCAIAGIRTSGRGIPTTDCDRHMVEEAE